MDKDRLLTMFDEIPAELKKRNSLGVFKVDKVDDMTDDEFRLFVLHKLSILSKDEQRMALDSLKRMVEEHKAEDEFTLRETIEHTLHSMIRSHEFSEYHHKQMTKADTNHLPQPDETKETNLSPAEILLLQYIDGQHVEFGLPGYFTHDYNIDYEAAITKFGIGGYLQYAGLAYTLNKLTVSQLKTILAEHGCKSTGTKPKLIVSVRDTLSPEEAEDYGKKFFKLTEKGQALINANSHIKYFHSSKNKLGIDIEIADKYKKAHPAASNEEIANALLDEMIKAHNISGSKGLMRNCFYSKSEVFRAEGKTMEQLRNLLIVCYLDVEWGKCHPQARTFAPGIVVSINSVVQSLNLRADDLRTVFDDAVSQFYEQVPGYEIEQTAEYVSNAFQELLPEIKFNQ